MLASFASFDCCHIAWLVFGIFTLLVLNDKPLLSFFNELPICLECGIQHCVMAKHQLCRRCVHSSAHCTIHSFRTCRQNAFETKKRIWVSFVLDLCTANHVVKCLVTPFNHGVRLQIATGDNLPFNAMFVFKSLADFSSEFSSLVHICFCRPWMSCKPTDFQPVGYHIGGLLTDLDFRRTLLQDPPWSCNEVQCMFRASFRLRICMDLLDQHTVCAME